MGGVYIISLIQLSIKLYAQENLTHTPVYISKTAENHEEQVTHVVLITISSFLEIHSQLQ